MTDLAEGQLPDFEGREAPEPEAQSRDVEVPAETSAVLEETDTTTVEDSEPESNGSVIPADGATAIDGNSEDGDQPGDDAEQITLGDVADRISSLEELFKSKISRSEYEEQVLKRYSDEIHEYKSDLYKKITLPLIKEIIGVRDATCAILERARNEESARTTVGIDSVEFICDMLETALDNYGVTVRHPEVGGMPEKGTERPIGRVKTAASEEHGMIAAAMNDAYLMDGKCISPAKVKVFVYDESLEDKTETQSAHKQLRLENDGQTGQAEAGEEPGIDEPAPAPVYKPE